MPQVILDELLAECLLRGGTEVYILPGRAPRLSTAERAVGFGNPLSAEETRELLLGCLSDAHRTVLELDRYVRFDRDVCLRGGTVAQYRGLVWLSDSGVMGAFTVCEPTPTESANADDARDALLRVLEAIDRRYGDAGWDLPAGDLDLPGPWDYRWIDPADEREPPKRGHGGRGGAPVPVIPGPARPVIPGPARPVRVGADAKPLPVDDLGDDNLLAQ